MKRPRKIDFEFGKKIYERGNFLEGFYNYYEAFGLCQYLIWYKEFGYQRCKTYLIEFSKRCDPSFNEVKSLDRINTVIKKAENKKPDSFQTVSLTEIELRNIEKIKDFKYQKILFSILVYAKRFKFDTTNQKKKKDFLGYSLHSNVLHNILIDMGLKVSKKTLPNFLNILYANNFLKDTGDQRYVAILYAEDNSKPVVEILDNENPWTKFVEYLGGEFIYCEICGEKVIKNSNRQKLCKKHAFEKERNRQR